MDRASLTGWLEQGLSLAEIGALVNRDASTIGYWIKKHGLSANGKRKYAPRGGLARDELEPLVRAGVSVREIATRLDRSPGTVRHWLTRHGLQESGSGRRDEVAEAVRNGNRTISRTCRKHGLTEFALVGSHHRPRCKACRSEAVARRRRKVKEILVEEAGGRCQLCGYDRCIHALQFHHRQPTEKSFGIAHRGLTRAISEVRTEMAKCVLLCSNCHVEVERGVASLA